MALPKQLPAQARNEDTTNERLETHPMYAVEWGPEVRHQNSTPGEQGMPQKTQRVEQAENR